MIPADPREDARHRRADALARQADALAHVGDLARARDLYGDRRATSPPRSPVRAHQGSTRSDPSSLRAP
jgi:hypothetical protein